MPNKAPAFLAEVTGAEAPVNQDKLTALRNEVVRAKKLALQIADLEEQLADANKELNELQQKTLPDLFMEIGIDEIAVPADGNIPAFKATCSPFYAAGIPVKWDAVKRQQAFAYLTELGAGDLIKTELNIKFGRDHRNEAVELAKELHDKGLTPDMKEAVHSATLTAWLREMVEINGFTPDLEKIGGTVGRVVKIKEKR